MELGGEGHCFYNCIAVGCALHQGKGLADVEPTAKAKGRALRQTIAEHIKKHEADYRPHWILPDPVSESDPIALQDVLDLRRRVEAGEDANTWDAYVHSLRRPARWTDEFAFRAAVR